MRIITLKNGKVLKTLKEEGYLLLTSSMGPEVMVKAEDLNLTMPPYSRRFKLRLTE